MHAVQKAPRNTSEKPLTDRWMARVLWLFKHANCGYIVLKYM